MPTNDVTGLPESPGKARLPAHCFVDNLVKIDGISLWNFPPRSWRWDP
jgi:hypothetical protein